MFKGWSKLEILWLLFASLSDTATKTPASTRACPCKRWEYVNSLIVDTIDYAEGRRIYFSDKTTSVPGNFVEAIE